MSQPPAFPRASVCLLVCALASPGLAAEDSPSRWFLSGGFGYQTTQDVIASNADIGSDPRPGLDATRETTVDDGLSLTLSGGVFLSSRVRLQVDVGYAEHDLGPIQGYLTEWFPILASNGLGVTGWQNARTTLDLDAGRITRIPVLLTGAFQFRQDRAVRPYVGAGAGVSFTEVSVDDDVRRVNSHLGGLRIRAMEDEHRKILTPEEFKPLNGVGRVPLLHPVSVEVEDGFTWHLDAGVEVSVSSNFSLVGDVRYNYSEQEVVIHLAGEDQVNFEIYSEHMFRPDGSLRFFASDGRNPNPLVNPDDPSLGTVKCVPNTLGDFDRDGHGDDLCYLANFFTTSPNTKGTLVLQGGAIELSGFEVTLGIRFYF